MHQPYPTWLARIAQPILSRIVYSHHDAGCTVEVRLARWEPLAALIVAIVLAIRLPSRIWIVLISGFAVLLALCAAWAIGGARGVRLERRLLHTWVQVGDRLEEVFTLINRSLFPLLAAEIEDRSDIPGYDLSAVRAAPPRDQSMWRQHGRSTRRGVFHLGPTTLRFGDPLGLFAVTVEHPTVRELLVYPPVLHRLALTAPAGGGQGGAASRLRSLEETAAFGGLRDYHPGDPIRRIHWPRTMRHRRFMVKEFDREMGGSLWLALDLDASVQAGAGDASTLEYGVIWAASWAWHLLRKGKPVGLVAYGPQRILIPPQAGSGYLWTLLRALAVVEPQNAITLEALLGEVRPYLRRGDSLVVLTPSVQPGWVEELLTPGLRSAIKHVALFDAATFDPSISQQATAESVQAVLSDLGIASEIIACEPDLMTQPAAPGGGDWEFTVTGLGRVVVKSRPAEVRG